MSRRIMAGLWLPLTILALWQISSGAGVLNPLFFPSPVTLVGAAGRLIESGELPLQLAITLRRIFLGFLIGSGCGLLCGLIMGAVKPVRRSLEPLVAALFTTPKISLLPMLMLFLGVGDTARILLIAAGSFVVMTLHSMDAVRDVKSGYLDLARSYNAGRLMLARKVYIPAALPQIFTGARLSLGRAVIITVAVELLSCNDGIGSMIWSSWQTFATEKLYVAVITTSLLGAILHHSLRGLEAKLIPWKH